MAVRSTDSHEADLAAYMQRQQELGNPYSTGSIGDQYTHQIGTNLAFDPSLIGDPSLYYETQGMNPQQFAQSGFSPWQLQNNGSMTYTGRPTNMPTWIDQGGAGDQGIFDVIKKIAPYAGLALGAGGLLGGLSNFGIPGISGGPMDFLKSIGNLFPGGGTEATNFLGGSMDMVPGMLGESPSMLSQVLPGGADWAGDTFWDAINPTSSGGGDFTGVPDLEAGMDYGVDFTQPGGAVDMGGNPFNYQSPPVQGGGGSGMFPNLPPGVGGILESIGKVLFGDGSNKGVLGSYNEYNSSGKNLDLFQQEMQNYMKQIQDFMGQAQGIADQADPFKDQRDYYQNLLRQSFEDPNFMNTGPFAQWRDTTVDEAKRQAAAMGWANSPKMFDHITQRLNAQNMNYLLPFQSQVGGWAGGNVNPGTAAQIQSGMLGTGLQAQGNLLNQIPNLIDQRQQKAGARGNAISQIPGILKNLGDVFFGNTNGGGNSGSGPTNTYGVRG